MKDYRQRANQIGRRNFKDDVLEVQGAASTRTNDTSTTQYRELNFQSKEERKPAPTPVLGVPLPLERKLTEPMLTVQLQVPTIETNSAVSGFSSPTYDIHSSGNSFIMRSPGLKRKSKSNLRISEDDGKVNSGVQAQHDALKSQSKDVETHSEPTVTEMSISEEQPLQRELDVLTAQLKETERVAELNAAKNAEDVQRIESAYSALAAQQARLLEEMKTNEENVNRNAGVASEALQREKAQLRERLDGMERDKARVQEELRESEAKARLEAARLQSQLAHDKRLLEASLARLEQEKVEMATRLETMAALYREQEAVLAQRLETEKAQAMVAVAQKDDLATAVRSAEAEKAALLAQAEQSRLELQRLQENNDKMLQEERLRLEATMDSLNREKNVAEKMRVDQEALRCQAAQEKLAMEAEVLRLRRAKEDADASTLAASLRQEEEKQQLLQIIREMKRENSRLADDLSSTAVSYQQSLQQQQTEYSGNMQQMRSDQAALESLVKQIAAATNQSSQTYQQSKVEMATQLAEMERDRLALAASLQSLEKTTHEQAVALEQQLAREKAEMLRKVEEAEREKQALAAALQSKEREAVETLEAVARRLKEENETRLEEEKRLTAVELALREERQLEALRVADKMAAELAEVQRQKAEMEVERVRLEQLARESEQRVRESQETASAMISKEREELLALVAKMKADFLAEQELKKQQESQLLPDKSSHRLIGSRLNTKTSLFNILEEQAAEALQEGYMDDLDLLRPIMERDEALQSVDNFDHQHDTQRRDSLIPAQFSHLSAPHALAASGHLRLLREMEQVEPYLLCSLDEAGRSPLFYAAANDHVGVCEYLCAVWPESAQYKDTHGDTPLHAASSAGSSACVALLLRYTKQQPENNMGMTAVHMAQNTDCLRLLFEAGYDFRSLDYSGRTPLFVACALNRIDCAQFVLDCLDSPEQYLCLQDSRGDTPLHAAACNGSVDCLLLLLQFAIDPTVRNSKGLQAIDLALKKKQRQCVKMLAEYALHFKTSADFDSQFFLAAVEGHKRIQDMKGTLEGYDIIKKGGTNGSGSSWTQLGKKESLFSLNTNRSIRLQRWGSWIAYEDKLTQKVFWYNHRTSEGRWDQPAGVQDLKDSSVDSQGNSFHHAMNHHKSSMVLKRNGDWIQYKTEFGHDFYYNEVNGKFQWNDPNGDSKHSDAPAMDNTAWKAYKDPDSGGIFWYNHETGVSQWDCPFEAGTGELKDDHDEAVHEVHDFSDLGI